MWYTKSEPRGGFVKVINLILILFFSMNLQAKDGEPDTEALYIVPTAPEFVSHSRFIVHIVTPFKGPDSEKIAYVFPEVLVGETYKVVELTRVEDTENQWTSDIMDAYCTTTDDIFSCNIVLKKESQASLMDLFIPKAFAQTALLSKEKSLSHLMGMNLSIQDKDMLKNVIDGFFSNEPAGILSYEYR